MTNECPGPEYLAEELAVKMMTEKLIKPMIGQLVKPFEDHVLRMIGILEEMNKGLKTLANDLDEAQERIEVLEARIKAN